MKRFRGILLLLVMTSGVDRAQDKDRALHLLPVERKGAYGYVEQSGGATIAPRFDQAARFSEALAAVQVDEEWGYINPTGAATIEPRFESARSFSEGRAVVRLHQPSGSKYFYVDRTGQVITSEGYDDADSFSQGFAAVRRSGRSFFIDSSGKKAFGEDAQFDSADSFSDGLARVSVAGHHGYINRTGKLVIATQFKAARSFSAGLAAVQEANGLWGYIDQGGTVRVKPQFESVGDFSEGLAPIRLSGKSRQKGFGFIDETGKVVIEPRFENARSFSEGLALVAVHDPYDPEPSGAGGEAADPTRWGFINPQGKMVILPHFLAAEDFHDGVAFVITAVTTRAYYIDRKGGLVTAASDAPMSLSSGFTNDYVWVSLSLESTPSGARVYMIPLFEWESDTNLPNEDDKLWVYQVVDKPGVTPMTTKVPREAYVIVFKLNDKIQKVQKQVRLGEQIVINIKFP